MNLNKSAITIRNINKDNSSNIYNKDLSTIINDINYAYEQVEELKELKNKIRNIKHAFINNWESEELPLVKQIINSISIDKGIPLPVLSICGKGTREIRFTQYLSYFLDSTKKHGLKNELLTILFDRECKEAGLDSNWSVNCKVVSEIKVGHIVEKNKNIECYGDIGIIGDDFIIIIEHKILSSESNHPETKIGQLERYNIALNNNSKFKDKKQIKIYLTPNEIQEIKIQKQWIHLTHKEIINRGIKLLKEDFLSYVARENLLRLLMDLAIGPYEVLESTLDEIVYIGNKLINTEFNLKGALQFNRLVEENNQIINILMEG